MNTKKITAGIGAGLALLGGGTMTADQIANPYTDKGAVMELRASSTIPFSGDVVAEVVKDRPEVRLKKWDDVVLSVRHDDVKAQGDRKFLTNKVEWKQGAKEVHAYPLEATAQMEDGGIEFEVVLNEKPDTNVFDFQIDGWGNLDFFYQPELTLEEIADGAERPENVVGSYAVYHKTKKNHLVGDTNYATGKAFHIFRPKAIDADGSEVWAQLSYEDGVLTVTVPEKFLSTATYPVRVDPTFGYTTIGGTSAQSNVKQGAKYTASPAGNIVSISTYCDMASGSTNIFNAIYTDSAGTPSSNIASSTVQGSCGTTPSWVTSSILGTVSNATPYWLMQCNSAGGAGNGLYYYDAGATNQRSFSSSGCTWASTWSNSGFSARMVSIYATYEDVPVAKTGDPIIWFD